MSSSTAISSSYPTEIQDRLEVLYEQECSFYMTTDYLGALVAQQQQLQQQEQSASKTLEDTSSSTSATTTSRSSKMLNQHWREVMCEWAYHVVDHFDFPRDIVSAAMSFLDRYLARHLATHTTPVPKQAFQLLAMTCLYVAVKLDQPRMLSLDTMAHLSRGTFTKAQMQAMELDILSNLQWHVHPPTPYTFLSHFMQLHGMAETKIYEMARYFVELSVLDYHFVGKRSSTVAVAALWNAVEDHHGCSFDMSAFCAPGEEHIVYDCRMRLRSLYQVPDPSVFSPTEEISGRTSSPTCVTQNIM